MEVVKVKNATKYERLRLRLGTLKRSPTQTVLVKNTLAVNF